MVSVSGNCSESKQPPAGDTLAGHAIPYFMAPDAIFDRNENLTAAKDPRALTPPEVAVLCYLYRRAGRSGTSWPSWQTIGNATGMTRRAAINMVHGDRRRPGSGLVAKGWLTVTSRRDPSGDPTSNLYALKVPVGGGVVNKGSARGARGVVNDVHQGSERRSPGVVNDVHPKDTQVEGRSNEGRKYMCALPEHTPTPSPSQGREKQEQDPPKPGPGRIDYPEEFEALWTAYPRKVEKKRAYREWRRQVKAGADAADMIQAAKHYGEHCHRQATPVDKIKHGRTFLSVEGDTWREWVDGSPERSSDRMGRRPGENEFDPTGTRKPGKVNIREALSGGNGQAAVPPQGRTQGGCPGCGGAVRAAKEVPGHLWCDRCSKWIPAGFEAWRAVITAGGNEGL